MVAVRGGKRTTPPKFLQNLLILCFERRLSKHNSVDRLESHILTPTHFFAWLRHRSIVSAQTGNTKNSTTASAAAGVAFDDSSRAWARQAGTYRVRTDLRVAVDPQGRVEEHEVAEVTHQGLAGREFFEKLRHRDEGVENVSWKTHSQ